jgi:hypothetical protein
MQIRWISRAVLLVVLLAFTEAAAVAGDDPYSRLVKNLEDNYHGKRTSIPFVGLANFVLKFWHPAGVKSVKLAVFANPTPTGEPNGPSFDSALKAAAASEWQPVVRVYSRADRQWVYVYMLEEGKDVKLLVATNGEREGVVAQVKFDPVKLAEFIQNPQIMGVRLAGDIKQGPDGGSSKADRCGSPSKAESNSFATPAGDRCRFSPGRSPGPDQD